MLAAKWVEAREKQIGGKETPKVGGGLGRGGRGNEARPGRTV